MRQYFIFYKRGEGAFSRLNPRDYRPLIDKEEVNLAIDVMGANPAIEGICVRIEDELFNITSTDREELLPDAFLFNEDDPKNA
jgi:hypothetical protein